MRQANGARRGKASTWCWLALFIGGLAASEGQAQIAWKPEKGVEIVVGTSPGGGQDTSARFVQKLIQERQLVDVPTVVVNKPGGGSSVGYAYLNQHPGDGHFIMLLTVPLSRNRIYPLEVEQQITQGRVAQWG